jgi:hypothetical protein
VASPLLASILVAFSDQFVCTPLNNWLARVSALQVKSPEFKPQNHQTKKQTNK